MQNGTSAKGHASVTAKTFAVLKKDDLQNMLPIFSYFHTKRRLYRQIVQAAFSFILRSSEDMKVILTNFMILFDCAFLFILEQ